MPERRTITADVFLRAIQQAEEYFDLPGVGTVKIKSLSTRDAQRIYQQHGNDRAALVVAVVSAGLVEPALTEEQVAALHDARSGPVVALFERIGRISGISETEEQAEELADLAGGGS
jgi:hypothetical protein